MLNKNVKVFFTVWKMMVCFKKLNILNLEYAKFKAESDMEIS